MLWEDVVQLACEGGDPEMPQWLDRLLPIAFDGATLTCATKLKWTERRVMANYREAIERSIHEITMEPIALAVVVDPSYFVDAPTAAPSVSNAAPTAGSAPTMVTIAAAGATPAGSVPTSPACVTQQTAGATATSTPAAAAAIDGTSSTAPQPATIAMETSGSIPTNVPRPVTPTAPAAITQTPATPAPTPATPAGTMSAAALAGAQAAASRTTHPLINLRSKIPASAQASMAAAQASAQPAPQSVVQHPAGVPIAQTAPVASPVPAPTGTPVASLAPSAPDASQTTASALVPAGTAPAGGTPQEPVAQDASQAPVPAATALTTDVAFEPVAPSNPQPAASVASAPAPDDALASAAPASMPAVAPLAGSALAQNTPQQSAAPLADATFDTFVVGEANRLAYDAARSVAEEEVVPYNPLFLYSKPGMGKTHLLQAIRNYIQMYRPGVRVKYAPTGDLVDAFTNDLNSGKRGTEILFDYRQADILLVDDVQFLRNKKETQVTFFDIFNQLTMQGKAVVLTADEPPDYLQLDDRLKQRFGSGLALDIASPSHELKLEILKRYAETFRCQMARMRDVRLPEDALDYMAELSPNSIREMLGFLKRVMMEQTFDPAPPLTHEHIKEVRDTLFKARRRVDIDTIIDVVCEEFDVPSADIKGKGRTKLVSEARQVTMWLARQLTDASYQAIGSPFGRDHSTVYTSISKIDNLSQTDPAYLNRLEQLKKKIESRIAQ